jgi:CelD/BcsL family acetyltransferase involved in cellulose biosynthesis
LAFALRRIYQYQLMQVQCVDNDNDFLLLEKEWEELWSNSVMPSYFLRYDWVRCSWEELRANNELRVFIVRDGNRPVLIAPWMRSRRTYRKLPLRSLTFIEHPETQVADMILAQTGDAQQSVETLMRYLFEKRSSEWDLLFLDKFHSGSKTLQLFERVRESARIRTEIRASHQALVISLAGSWDEYLNHQSVRFRKTLRNVANRMARVGTIEVRCYGETAGDEAVRKLFSVSDASWKIAEGVAITSSTVRMRFFEQLLETATTAKGLWIWLLEVNGRPVASETQIVDGQTIYAIRSDYDEHYADFSPGTYLQMEILKRLFEMRYAEYNFGVGLNPYKTRWTDQHVDLMSCRLFNDSFYGRLLGSMDRYDFSKLTGLSGLRTINGLFSGKT